MIYTVNEIAVFKVFKGEVQQDKIEVVTLGGVVGERYVRLSHNIEFSKEEEGIFFLTEKEGKLYPANNPLQYHFDGVNSLAYDGFRKYFSLENDLYTMLGKAKIVANNTIESKQKEWQERHHLAQFLGQSKVLGGDVGIVYSFENAYFSGAMNQYLEFDIYATNEGFMGRFGRCELLLDYNPLTFGGNIAASGSVTVTKGSIILNPDYSISVSDSAWDKLRIAISAPISPNINNLYALGITKEQLCHIQINVGNVQVPSILLFDEAGMQGRSEDYDTAAGYEDIGYVSAIDSLIGTSPTSTQSATGIFYSFENLQLTDGSGLSKMLSGTQYMEFDIYAWATDSGTLLSYADVYMDYNNVGFGSYIGMNGTVTVMDATLIADTSIYNSYYTDNDYNTLNIYYIPDNPSSGTGLYVLPTTPTPLCHVGIEIAACDEPVNLSFNQPLMDNMSFHYTGAALPHESYSPTIANDTETATMCPTSGNPVIYSFSPKIIRAGAGDTLTIHGDNFGQDSVTRKVWFRSADDENIEIAIESIEKLTWADSLIVVRVPSTSTTKEGAGTGPILITKGSGASNVAISSDTLQVRYSLTNALESSTNFTYRVNLPDDNGSGGFTFSVSDNIAQIPNAKACVDSAMTQWKCLTHVNFELGSDTTINPTYTADLVPNDGINHIFFAPNTFWTSANPPKAQTIEAGDFKNCNDGFNNYVYYTDEIDIVINQDVPYPFFYSFTQPVPITDLDFYSTILHELGHANRLEHSNEANKLMYYFRPEGVMQRFLTTSEIDGGSFVVANNQLSALDPIMAGCTSQPFPYPMIPAVCGAMGIENGRDVNHTLLTVFPNPIDETLQIRFHSSETSEIQVLVKDMLGRIVYAQSLPKYPKGLAEIAIELPSFIQEGIYLLSIQTSSTMRTAKIIVQH